MKNSRVRGVKDQKENYGASSCSDPSGTQSHADIMEKVLYEKFSSF